MEFEAFGTQKPTVLQSFAESLLRVQVMNDLPWGVQFPFEALESRSTPILPLDVVSVSNEVQEKFASGNLAQFNPTIYPVTLPHPGYRSIRTYHAY